MPRKMRVVCHALGITIIQADVKAMRKSSIVSDAAELAQQQPRRKDESRLNIYSPSCSRHF